MSPEGNPKELDQDKIAEALGSKGHVEVGDLLTGNMVLDGLNAAGIQQTARERVDSQLNQSEEDTE